MGLFGSIWNGLKSMGGKIYNGGKYLTEKLTDSVRRQILGKK